MSPTADTVLILIGALFLLIGLLGGGVEISAIKVPTAAGPQRVVLGLVGIVMIVFGAKYMMGGTADEHAPPGVAGVASAASTGEPAASVADVTTVAPETSAPAQHEDATPAQHDDATPASGAR